jgi:NAD-dependent SIR2 family protein deacetylase
MVERSFAKFRCLQCGKMMDHKMAFHNHLPMKGVPPSCWYCQGNVEFFEWGFIMDSTITQEEYENDTVGGAILLELAEKFDEKSMDHTYKFQCLKCGKILTKEEDFLKLPIPSNSIGLGHPRAPKVCKYCHGKFELIESIWRKKK